jgi:hypothetical protein
MNKDLMLYANAIFSIQKKIPDLTEKDRTDFDEAEKIYKKYYNSKINPETGETKSGNQLVIEFVNHHETYIAEKWKCGPEVANNNSAKQISAASTMTSPVSDEAFLEQYEEVFKEPEIRKVSRVDKFQITVPILGAPKSDTRKEFIADIAIYQGITGTFNIMGTVATYARDGNKDVIRKHLPQTGA